MRRQRINLSKETMEIVIPNCIVDYAYIDKPDNNGMYRGLFICDKSDIVVKAKNAIEAFATAGKEEMGVPVDISGYVKDDGIEIAAKSKYEPNKAFRPACESEEIYSGAPVDVQISLYYYLYAGEVGVAYGLRAVCKNGEGERRGVTTFEPEKIFGGDIKGRISAEPF